MEAVQLDELLKVFESSLSQIKWKLKPSSKRRLETDMLALITEMRPVIMVDYGGKMPELQDRLCSFVKQCEKESLVFEPLKVMVMEDMIYLVHTCELERYARLTLDREIEILFVDLEQDPPKMMAQTDKTSAAMDLMSIQERFSTVFHSNLLQSKEVEIGPPGSKLSSSTSEFIDLSSWIEETQVTIPALNGWLLGYPVIYLFGKQHIQDAIYNLSTKSLHLFKILVCR
ncbi:hypothetical protein M9H77_30686 [Catharanthus roseus]|uniref:Uncharacterized protein n=1 Tax=Catharanthus roseus TaxID=4058 RepID=A0ACB9ZYA0_CATRO|nr:hypothetical protein M9H77_30686 [Catharanthus roseus]